jgi:MFS family permease
LYVLTTSAAGFGLGIVQTLNTLVAQLAVPKRLLGVAVGVLFFFQMVGIAIAPAILGLAQRSSPYLEIGLQRVFLVSAVAMVISLIVVIPMPDVSMATGISEKPVT